MIGTYLQNKLGEVFLLSEVSSEITYGIPNENVTKFKAFFKDFDNDMEKLGIMSYGMSITTLEDVFLSINKEFG
jgi:archaellum component FlaC